MKATVKTHPNIAVIKYWGKRNLPLNLPAVSSLSVTLDTFYTTTTVSTHSSKDTFIINGQEQRDDGHLKISEFLDSIHPTRSKCMMISENNFPTAAGLASSASAFSALAYATCLAFEKEESQFKNWVKLSVMARLGSGSACRSLWGGWVHWPKGVLEDGSDSHGIPLADQNHWNIQILVAVVDDQKKAISSRSGMLLTQQTSPLYEGWCSSSEGDIDVASAAILSKDIHKLGTVMEHSTMKMHATMLSANPSICYLKPKSLEVIEMVKHLRLEGYACYYTMDAGPNVKILCPSEQSKDICTRLQEIIPNVHVLGIGGNAQICDKHLSLENNI
jgi:diphosphomevalonate decarboxylase